MSWIERYRLSISENLSIKEIMQLRNVGQPKALEIRKKAIEYCLMNEIEISCNRVPTEIVLMVTSCSVDYYYKKMIQENEVNIILGKELQYVNS